MNDVAFDALRPEVVIFGDQPGVAPRLTMFERRPGGALLLHEALDGSIELRIDEDGMRVATTRRRES